jgi:hypothetical protein
MGVPDDQNHPDEPWVYRESSLELESDEDIPDAYIYFTLSSESY